jgi:acyl dehydratase
MDSTLYFEDLAIGMVIEGADVVVDRTEMLDFARRFDPQPFHLDKAAAARLPFRDVIASGAYTFALATRAMQPVVRRLAFLPSGIGFELSFKGSSPKSVTVGEGPRSSDRCWRYTSTRSDSRRRDG